MKKEIVKEVKKDVINSTNTETVDFKTALKYPFNRPIAMLNILWLLLPLFGWFSLGGYGIRIIREFTQGKFEELPELDFVNDLKLGFFILLRALPLIIVYMFLSMFLMFIPLLGPIINLLIGLLLPMLFINLFVKETVGSSFEFKVIKVVFENVGEYLIALLKSIGLGLIFLLMVLILVGIPANAFTKNIFLADFYRRYVK